VWLSSRKPYELFPPGLDGNISKIVPRRPLKYQEWYPQLESALSAVSISSCQLSLQAYMGNMTARVDLNRRGYPSYCNLHTDCILATVYQSIVSHMAAASVLLGLTPTILANLGPTISEISLLSSQRPFLSFLLAMGAPATFPTRFLPYSDPLKLLQKTSGLGLRKIRRVPKPWAAVLSLLQYIVISIAIWNVMTTSLQLGRRTVISWGCQDSWLPLAWSLSTIGVHAPAVLSFKLYQWRSKEMHSNTQRDNSNKTASFFRVMRRNLTSIWRNETIISANVDSLFVAVEVTEPSTWSIGLQA